MEPMKTVDAMLIGEKFPGKRVDFIMKQAVWLLTHRMDSRMIVLNGWEKTDESETLEFKDYDLPSKIDYLDIPKGCRRIPEVASVTNHPIKFIKSLNSRYYPMNFTLKNYLAYKKIKKLNYKINTLHCHFGQIGLVGDFLKRNGLCKRLVISFYGGDLTGYVNRYGNVYKSTFESADYLIACTEFLKNKLIELGADEKKIIMFYLPQDPGFFKKSDKRKNNEIKILTVARLIEEKGVQNAIDAMKILSGKYPNIKYSIVGDGPYKEELESLVEKNSLQKVVKFKGLKGGKEKLQEYQEADIFVLPSISTHKGWVEGGGLVNLEAQLCEIPVVASNCGGIPEYVLDGITGLLAEENAEDLAKKISILIENPKMREKMGSAGAKHVRNNFSIKNLEAMKVAYGLEN